MVFSSITFLFYFLPAVMLLYLLAGKKRRNIVLLTASLFFYAWGEGIYVLLMLASIAINYAGGRLVDSGTSSKHRKTVLVLTILLNLLILGFFKYANFLTDNLNILLSSMGVQAINLAPVRLPIGISFFTFQALSYIIDVYRKKVSSQKNIINLALYISLFPQLIAGPIVRYHDIARDLSNRKTDIENISAGIQRFIFGLSKKVLLANPMGAVADQIFTLSTADLTTPMAWLGAVCYTLRMYFDFSGYSDMAIGLGRIFGFHFLENFNYPYISGSIREFWRRWHISLSNWFRDYVYIPLGGNRKGTVRTGLNLVAVFFLCGLWHGAAWTFVSWGFYHGFFLVLERSRVGTVFQHVWRPLRIWATLVIVIVGWVIFRSETLPSALQYLAIMSGRARSSSPDLIFTYLDSKQQCELVTAMIFTLPVYPWLTRIKHGLQRRSGTKSRLTLDATTQVVKLSAVVALCYFSFISLAAGMYNPFIYFRF